MAKRDYYEVLGVSRKASTDEIRRAYRDLARRFHPDVSKEADSQARFTEVQEAYDVLFDEKKRAIYDQVGHAGVGPSGSRGAHYNWANAAGQAGGAEVDIDDLGSMFDTFFGGREEGFGGVGSAGARQGRAGRRPSGPVRGADISHILDVTFMTAARGGSESLTMTRSGKTRTIDVTIPQAIDDGAKLRVKGEGEPAGAGRSCGDLIITVRVGGHPIFRRGQSEKASRGLDLTLDLPLTICEATLGGTVSVPTLDGSVELVIPPGTASGKKLRLRGRGLANRQGRCGDLYAVVGVVPPEPEALTDDERQMLDQIGQKTPNPRSGPGWPT